MNNPPPHMKELTFLEKLGYFIELLAKIQMEEITYESENPLNLL